MRDFFAVKYSQINGGNTWSDFTPEWVCPLRAYPCIPRNDDPYRRRPYKMERFHCRVSDVTVARLGRLPLSGLIVKRRCVMSSTGTVHDSRSNVV